MNELSFVVQGPIRAPWTRQCLDSIKKFHPDSPIIISTWHGPHDSDQTFGYNAQFILCDDPGPVNNPNLLNPNINRLIVSSRAGLSMVWTPFVCKLRSDVWLSRPISLEPIKHIGVALMTHSVFSLNPWGQMPLGMHLSDWGLLGQTAAAQRVFEIPHMRSDSPELRNEQYLWHTYAASHLMDKPPPMRTWDDRSCHEYTRVFCKNHLIVGDLGIKLKDEEFHQAGCFISFDDWKGWRGK